MPHYQKTFSHPFKRYNNQPIIGIGRLSADADCQMADTNYRHTDYRPIIGAPLVCMPVVHTFGLVWAREHCRISPPRFLAECCKRQLNQGSFVLLYFRLFTFSDLYWVCLSVFSCTVLFVSISQVIGCEDRLQMTYIVSSRALNSTPTNQSILLTQWPLTQISRVG